MNKTNIVLKGIRADEMSFKLNNVRPQEGKLDLKPTFSRKVRRAVENERVSFVTLSVQIASAADSPKPFDLFASVTGIFETDASTEEEKRFAVVECTQLLFPYLRSAVTNLTTAAMSAPVVLPVVSGPLFPEDRKLADEYFG